MITKDKLRLKLLKIKKIGLSRMFEKVQKKIDELYEEIKEDKHYKDFVKNKCCIVCSHSDYKNDFRFPVCTHPCNRNGKDRLKYYMHTCENWKKEKTNGN